MNRFFFNDTATPEIYTLSLHDALPIFRPPVAAPHASTSSGPAGRTDGRSEEHTSELQSQFHIVCRLLLEKKKYSALSYTSFPVPPSSDNVLIRKSPWLALLL